MQSVRGEDIRLENVWVTYSGSGKPAIKNINFILKSNSFILIAGPNGAGKTTLIETCLGLLKPIKGKAYLLGVDTKSRNIVKVRRKCSYVPQDFMKPPHESYTVRQVIEFGLALQKTFFKKSSSEINKCILWSAKLFNIENLLDKPIGSLSGGQQQKVYIARAFARKPKIIFLDEPFSSLDQSSRENISNVIKRYVIENGASAIVVSHDINPLKNIVDEIIWMKDGEIVKIEKISE